MTLIDLICPVCSIEFKKYIGHYNRAMKRGDKVYCGRTCAGIGRRDNKTIEQKKAEKAEYDKNYGYYHREGIKEKKAKAFQKEYKANPDKYREIRKKKYPKHLEYLRTPDYRDKKKQYDQKYRGEKYYGPFAEAARILFQIEELIDNREVKSQQKLNNKSIKRKRLWTKNRMRILPQ